MGKLTKDPIEEIVATALDATGLWYRRGEGKEADFVVPGLDIEIECKQFYSARAIRQLEGKENVILVQGRAAASIRTFYRLIERRYNADALQSLHRVRIGNPENPGRGKAPWRCSMRYIDRMIRA